MSRAPVIPSWARPVDDKLATATTRGLMSPADKQKLDALVPGDDLTVSPPLTLVGTTLDIALATATTDGSMPAADKAKLDQIPAHPLVQVNATAPLSITAPDTNQQTVSIAPATGTAPGSMSAADKAKLDGLVPGQVNVLEDVTLASSTTAVAITNGGAGGIVGKVKAMAFTIANAVAGGAAGLMTGADKTKLDGITAGATPTVLDSVTGTAPIVAGALAAKSQAISITPATTSAAGSMSAADKTKLDGLTAGGGGGTVSYGTSGEIILTATPTGAYTGPSVGKLTRLAGPEGDAHLRTSAHGNSDAFIEAGQYVYQAANAYKHTDGNWYRWDTGKASRLVALSAFDGLVHVYRAAAGAGAITWGSDYSFDPLYWALAANPPRGKAYGGSLAGPPINTWTAFGAASYAWNTGGALGGTVFTSANPLKFSAPLAGIYHFEFDGRFYTSGNAGGATLCCIRIAGSNYAGQSGGAYVGGGVNNVYFHTSLDVEMAAGQLAEPLVFSQVAVPSMNVEYFSGRWVSPT